MTPSDMLQQRLTHQRLAAHPFETAHDAVAWMGAVQAQDYPAAKWAVAQRTNGLKDAAIEQAVNEGSILRTHVLRPTWHFVTSEDIRWMLKLTAPRVHALNGFYYRKLELDEAVFTQSRDILVKALEGGQHLMREELGSALSRAGIETSELLRLAHILMWAELEGVVCSGAYRGKQATYALLNERAPNAKILSREESLAEMAQRYFISHGPATLKDYIWWSGLSAADAKAGLDMVKSSLMTEMIEGQAYWFDTSLPSAKSASETVYLLPNYDEYMVAYKDRSAIFDESHTGKLDARGNILFNHTIVIDGRVAGIWKRTVKKGGAVIESTPFVTLTPAQNRAFVEAVQRFGDFLGLPVALV